MDDYRSALIIKLALIDVPAFVTIVAYMLTGGNVLLGIAVILIIVFLIYTPNRNKLINELELNSMESEIINNPEAKIQ